MRYQTFHLKDFESIKICSIKQFTKNVFAAIQYEILKPIEPVFSINTLDCGVEMITLSHHQGNEPLLKYFHVAFNATIIYLAVFKELLHRLIAFTSTASLFFFTKRPTASLKVSKAFRKKSVERNPFWGKHDWFNTCASYSSVHIPIFWMHYCGSNLCFLTCEYMGHFKQSVAER